MSRSSAKPAGSSPSLAVGVDVGSVRRRGGFSWASSDGRLHGEDDPSALAALVVTALDGGQAVALAFECPLSVPVPGVGDGQWRDLGRARAGEGNRPWSAGAGASVLGVGLVQLAWICRYIAENCAVVPSSTTQVGRYLAGEARLLIAEAMVTSTGKPLDVGNGQDHADALAAAKRLGEILDGADADGAGRLDVSCRPHRALNLAALALMHAGLPMSADELSLELLVAKVRPVGAEH